MDTLFQGTFESAALEFFDKTELPIFRGYTGATGEMEQVFKIFSPTEIISVRIEDQGTTGVGISKVSPATMYQNIIASSRFIEISEKQFEDKMYQALDLLEKTGII